MRIFSFLTFIPAFLTLGANAAAISEPAQSGDLVSRCDTCEVGPGVGNGIWADVYTSVDVDAALNDLSRDQCTFTSEVVDIFAHITGDVKAQADSVLTIGAKVLDWSTTDLADLGTALDAYIAGTVSTGVNIFVKAGIDVAVFTTTEAACLRAFIAICVQSDVQLATGVKADIILFIKNAIVVANTTCADLQARIHVKVSALLSVVNCLHLDVKVATCASAAAAIKIALKAYIQSCIASTTGITAVVTKATLKALLQIVDAWIATDFGLLSGVAIGLLGIDLKAASDAAICKAIVAFLLSINAKFNFVSAYGLDAALYAQVFSTIVAH
ncbi:hypothetical protein FS837_013048 [Tulasnella sp. UAMH 9824]|nr:hypothetical protein FS837_013048 [Tulasnella sp. UAMH 9824]